MSREALREALAIVLYSLASFAPDVIIEMVRTRHYSKVRERIFSHGRGCILQTTGSPITFFRQLYQQISINDSFPFDQLRHAGKRGGG